MLQQLGYTNRVQERINTTNTEELARVITVHKDSYIVRNAAGIFRAEITGNLRFSAQNSEDFPAVGDWVRITLMDKNTAIILEIFERFSTLKRQAVGKYGEDQLIATNIDYAYVTMSATRDFNLNRLDRYIAICRAGNIEPIVLLTKTDLSAPKEVKLMIDQINQRHSNIAVATLSIEQSESFQALTQQMIPNMTYCLVGSSGVGKSTIINYLMGNEGLKTNEISESTQKGKHTTTHRELFILDNESIVIDTPGMREVGISSNAEGIASTFDQIVQYATHCKFKDCTHTNEVGCAILDAIDSGELSYGTYESYMKLQREQQHYSKTVMEKKQQDKSFGKMVKRVKQLRKNNKF
ncbi:ribosome small subunit-dependent GTPase A [Puteibacter caeruleilacunae]|nr:ribosome small subunit-dependent GTPase A [Puteibacter caeruleilacunae]